MKKLYVRASKVLAMLVASIALLLCLPLTAAAQGPEIFLDPTPVNVQSGNTFTVALKINNIPDPCLAAYDFAINFSAGVIQFGTSVGDHDWGNPDFGDPLAFNVDNTAGVISFNDVATASNPCGNITLVVLHGTAISAVSATSPLLFDKAEILDPSGGPISAAVTDGEVIVTAAPGPTITPTPSPVPTTSQWGLIGMATVFAALLIWFVRRRWVANAGKS